MKRQMERYTDKVHRAPGFGASTLREAKCRSLYAFTNFSKPTVWAF